MTSYNGIRVTTAATNVTFIKIASGVHNIVVVGSSSTNLGTTDPDGSDADISAFTLTTVTVDASNNIFSGYDGDGNRYIFDKGADITAALA